MILLPYEPILQYWSVIRIERTKKDSYLCMSKNHLMKYLDKYANLLLEIGVALQEGQNLVIQTEPIHAKFAYLVERLAYEKGARLVSVELSSPESKLNRANFSKEEYLDYVTPYLKEKFKGYVDDGWALIHIGGKEDMKALQALNQENNAVMHRAVMPLLKDLIMARSMGKCTWTIGNMPTPDWARSIWPDSNASDQAICEQLWEAMIPILRLDQPDPVEAWKTNSAKIHERAGKLNAIDLDHLHFEGEGTDLKVYMTAYYKFIGGSQPGQLGQDYTPNLPTEEFFTTPDYRRTSDSAKVTRPVSVMGMDVVGAWFEFENGKVVNYGASEHEDRLDAFFKLDPKARYLGEVALVDCTSPIYQSRLVFNDILYDENASCHIALGRGIAMALPKIKEKSAEELDELGCNNSTLHTDFMIGNEALQVTAYSKSGEAMKVIVDGAFVI